MIFYSPSVGGFYAQDIHGDSIPADARPLTRERHAELLASQADGQAIVPGPDGDPILQDPAATAEGMASAARLRRDAELRAADIAINKLEDAIGDTTAWRAYRQALRDVPLQAGFPASINWPAAPAAQ